MPTMIVNEDGEPLGFDYPEYDYSDDYFDDIDDYADDYEEDGEEQDARGDSQYPETDLIWEG
jgi:hypothetical protein